MIQNLKVYLTTWGYGAVFERVKTLCDKMYLVRENGGSVYLSF